MPCLWCDTAIDPDDRGTAMGMTDADGNASVVYAHIECAMRNVTGCLAHLEDRGHDHTGDYRTDALAVWRWTHRHMSADADVPGAGRHVAVVVALVALVLAEIVTIAAVGLDPVTVEVFSIVAAVAIIVALVQSIPAVRFLRAGGLPRWWLAPAGILVALAVDVAGLAVNVYG